MKLRLMGMVLLAACTDQAGVMEDPEAEPGYSPPRYRYIDLGPYESISFNELSVWMLGPDSILHHVVVPDCLGGANPAGTGCSVNAIGSDMLAGTANLGGPGTGVPAAWRLQDYAVTEIEELEMGDADFGGVSTLSGPLAGGSLYRADRYRAVLWQRRLGAWGTPFELPPLPPYEHAGVRAIDEPFGNQKVLGGMSAPTSAGSESAVVWTLFMDKLVATSAIPGTDWNVGRATAINGKRIVGYSMSSTAQSGVLAGPLWWEVSQDGTQVSEPMALPMPDGFTAGVASAVRGNTVYGFLYERPAVGSHAMLWHFGADGTIETFDISPSPTAEWTLLTDVDEFGRIMGVHFDPELDATASHRFVLVPDVVLVPEPT
jgi:hypothetical protein